MEPCWWKGGCKYQWLPQSSWWTSGAKLTNPLNYLLAKRYKIPVHKQVKLPSARTLRFKRLIWQNQMSINNEIFLQSTVIIMVWITLLLSNINDWCAIVNTVLVKSTPWPLVLSKAAFSCLTSRNRWRLDIPGSVDQILSMSSYFTSILTHTQMEMALLDRWLWTSSVVNFNVGAPNEPIGKVTFLHAHMQT